MAITTKATSNFSFRKLADAFDEVFDGYMEDSYEDLAQSARDNIKNSTGIAPLKESSKYIRRKGYSPKGYGGKTTSTKPLVWTGNLLRSIKATKNGVQAVGYLKHHMEGYTVGGGKFADKFNFKGKKVKPRNPFFTNITESGKGGNLKAGFKKGAEKRMSALIKKINKVWRTPQK